MDTKLIKIRFAFDDPDLKARVCGAQLLHVTHASYVEGTPEAQLCELVKSRPTSELFELMTEVISNGTIQNALVFDPSERRVDSSAVLDTDIEYVVGVTWSAIAARYFGAPPAP